MLVWEPESEIFIPALTLDICESLSQFPRLWNNTYNIICIRTHNDAHIVTMLYDIWALPGMQWKFNS